MSVQSRAMRILATLLGLAACGSPPTTSTTPPVANHPAGPSSGHAIALAVVFNGWELFAGNTTLVERDDPARYEGVLPAIDAEVAKLHAAGGAGSLAALIVYDDRATVAHALAPLDELAPGWFGTQKTYFGKFGVELMTGLDLAAQVLAKAPGGLERVILVIGDGCDTNPEAARGRLAQLDLAKARISLHQIQIATPLSAECPPLDGATQHGKTLAAGFDHFVAALRQ